MYPCNSETQVGEITQEKRFVHVLHGRHCLLVSPDVEDITLFFPALDVVMALCQGVTALQHPADCDVVTGSEQQATNHSNHGENIVNNSAENIDNHSSNGN